MEKYSWTSAKSRDGEIIHFYETQIPFPLKETPQFYTVFSVGELSLCSD
jgi:hypothetical protein